MLPEQRKGHRRGRHVLAGVVVAVAICTFVSGPPNQDRAAARAGAATAATDAPFGWQVTATGLDRVPESAVLAAAAIEVAVVDTGADVPASSEAGGRRPSAYNVQTHSGNVTDANGHGTFVASLAAGLAGDGTGTGNVRLLVVKAAGADGALTTTDEAKAIRYATDHGARIINVSFAGSTTSPAERQAIRYAASHGVLLVAAAGNAYDTGNPVEYPAALLQPVGSNGAAGAGLVVAASTSDGSRAQFSGTGSWISLAAPGEDVLGAVSEHSSPTAYPRTPVPGLSGLFGYASGTSFAAPQVARAAALVWGVNPRLRASDVARILKETASGGGTWTPELGFGVIDVAAAVARATALRPSP